MAQQIVDKKDRREGKGRVIALSRRVYRISKTDVFYVESESIDGMFYYTMFDTAQHFEWCSCKDFENHHNKCKHIFGVEFAIKDGTVKDIDKLPADAKKDNQIKDNKLEYERDDYGF